MSNLEHLIENGLSKLEEGCTAEEWRQAMKDDINWLGVEHITIKELWVICQYVMYVYVPTKIDEVLESYGL